MSQGSYTNTGAQPETGSPDVSNTSSQNGVGTKLFLALAAFALGQALQIGNGALTTPSILWLTLALIFGGMSIVSQRWPFPYLSPKLFSALLVAGLIWQVFQLLTTLPGLSVSPAYLPRLWQFRTAIAVGGVCALLSLAPSAWLHPWVRRALIAAVFVAVLAAGLRTIRSSPDPFIDVYVFQQTSSQALLQGKDPYELTPPNIYGNLKYYGPELVNKGKMTIGNPYPPLSIYLSLLGYVVAGDVRHSYLAAILLTGLLILFLRPGRESLLAAYIFLFTPRLFLVLEQSWTEPIVLLLAVAVVWCAIHRPKWKFIALGLLLASKQYMLFLLPMAVLLLPAKTPRWKWTTSLAWTAGVATAVTAPLALWNVRAFVWNVGLAQLYQPFRMDALSYAALYARHTGHVPTPLLPFIMLGAFSLFAWRYGERSPAGFAAALALGLALFFAFNKQAFCNYYFLVVGLFCGALAAASTPDALFRTSRSESG